LQTTVKEYKARKVAGTIQSLRYDPIGMESTIAICGVLVLPFICKQAKTMQFSQDCCKESESPKVPMTLFPVMQVPFTFPMLASKD